MGVEDIMREQGGRVESDPRNLPATADDSPTTASPDETTTDREAQARTENAADSDLPTPPDNPFKAIEDRVDVKLSLDDAGNVAAALSLAAKLLG